MTVTEIRNGNGAVLEREGREISDKVAEQVNAILEEAGRDSKAPRPAVAYRIPSPGVRYYF